MVTRLGMSELGLIALEEEGNSYLGGAGDGADPLRGIPDGVL